MAGNRKDQTMSDDSSPAMRLRDLAEGWTTWPSYKTRYNHDAVKDAHYGIRELLDEAETSQRLLDHALVKDGPAQGGGDLDSRVAEAVWRLVQADGNLAAIAAAHDRERGPAGMVGDFCIECERRWPCPTYEWASGERPSSDSWDGAARG